MKHHYLFESNIYVGSKFPAFEPKSIYFKFFTSKPVEFDGSEFIKSNGISLKRSLIFLS